jgi:hypothetical protein
MTQRGIVIPEYKEVTEESESSPSGKREGLEK